MLYKKCKSAEPDTYVIEKSLLFGNQTEESGQTQAEGKPSAYRWSRHSSDGHTKSDDFIVADNMLSNCLCFHSCVRVSIVVCVSVACSTESNF